MDINDLLESYRKIFGIYDIKSNIILGTLFLFLSFHLTLGVIRDSRFNNGISTKAIVLSEDLSDCGFKCIRETLTYSYIDNNGEKLVSKGNNVGFNFKSVGDIITIQYDKNDPTKTKISLGIFGWFLVALMQLFAPLFFLHAYVLYLQNEENKRIQQKINERLEKF